MTVYELIHNCNPNINKISNPDFCLIISENDKLMNNARQLRSYFKGNFFTDEQLAMPLLSFNYCSKLSYDFKRTYYNILKTSASGRTILEWIEKTTFDATILVLRVCKNNYCYVVTEEYYNDGTHNTVTKCVQTNIKNVSESFTESDFSDVFTRPFPTEEDAIKYLRSKEYINLVSRRCKNRIAKNYKR